MKLSTKLTLGISASLTAVLVACGVLLARQEGAFLDDQLGLHGRLLGRVVASMVAQTWAERGEDEARELLRAIDRHEPQVRVRWVSLAAGAPLLERVPDARKRLLRGEIVDRIRETGNGNESLHTFVPITRDGNIERVIEVDESLQAREAHLAAMLVRLGLVVAGGLLLSGVLAHVFGRFLVGRPVRDLVSQTRRVASGDLSTSISYRSRDELGELAREMRTMVHDLRVARERARMEEAARHRAEAELQQAERLIAVGRFAAGLAHEIGTPLHVIALQAELLDKRAGDSKAIADSAAVIRRQTTRMVGIVRGLLRFARREPPKLEPRSLPDLVERALEPVEQARPDNKVIQRRFDGQDLVALVDEDQLQQVVTNLATNGLQAMQHGGTLTVGVRRERSRDPNGTGSDDGEYLCLYVEDEGSGIAEDAVPHLFEPFFTTKDVGEGTGLGLSISHGVVEEHGGWIDVKTRVGAGSRFSVYLPAAPAHQEGGQPCPG